MRSEKEDNFLNKIKKDRHEERWNILPKDIQAVEDILSNYELEKYDNPWVSTIYFGGVKDNDSGEFAIISTSVANLSIRARKFTNTSIARIEQNGDYRFEVKITPKIASHKRKKYIANLKFSTIEDALYTGDYEQLAKSNEKYLEILPKILRDIECNRFVPIGIMHYLRQHYVYIEKQNIDKSLRITYDTNISVWDVDNSIQEYTTTKIHSFEHNVLEIKSTGGRKQYPEAIQNVVSNFDKAKSKRDLLFDKLQEHSKISVCIK